MSTHWRGASPARLAWASCTPLRGTPASPQIATCHDVPVGDLAALTDLARRAGRRPGRGRAGGAAGGGPGRPAGRRGRALLRPGRRGRPDRGLQGVRQGGDGRRRRAHRRLLDLRYARRRAARHRRGRRQRRDQGRRPGRGQGRVRLQLASPRPSDAVRALPGRPPLRRRRRAGADRGAAGGRGGVDAGAVRRRDACCRWRRRATTSARSTATAAPTPAAWAASRRCRGSTRRPWTSWWPPCTGP